MAARKAVARLAHGRQTSEPKPVCTRRRSTPQLAIRAWRQNPRLPMMVVPRVSAILRRMQRAPSRHRIWAALCRGGVEASQAPNIAVLRMRVVPGLGEGFRPAVG